MKEAARFSTLCEAEVAITYLAAHGVHAFIADRGMATVDPILQTALGGVRVLTPDGEAGLARDLLGSATPAGPPDAETDTRRRSAGDYIFRLVTVVAALLMGQGFAGAPYRGPRGRLSGVQIAGLVLLSSFVLLGLGSILLGRLS